MYKSKSPPAAHVRLLMANGKAKPNAKAPTQPSNTAETGGSQRSKAQVNDTVALNTVLPGDDGWYRLSEDVQVQPVHSERIAMDGGTHYNRTVVVAPKGGCSRAWCGTPPILGVVNFGM